MGGILEIVWAVSFKTGSIGLHTLIAIFASFDLLIRAAKVLPVGTVYAVFAYRLSRHNPGGSALFERTAFCGQGDFRSAACRVYHRSESF